MHERCNTVNAGIPWFIMPNFHLVVFGPPTYRSFFTKSMSTARTYGDAIEHLNSLQFNAANKVVPAPGVRRSQFAIPKMLEYLERIGYKPEALNALNVIHITGTKGKGSTSAFVSSILQHTVPSWKVGLYTSPHMVAVRERIRINGTPISEEDFTKYFFEVWDRLVPNGTCKLPTTPMPGYFRFMTLLAFHTFLQMKVDATILEVGVGGTYDSTNLVPKPVVTGVTALGIDHVSVLGKTLKEIAWHKGGLFKEGVPAITVTQPEEGMEVLRERAKELKVSSLRVIDSSTELSSIPLGLAGQHQVQNAAIAVELARVFLKSRDALQDSHELPRSFLQGLKEVKWPGRCQTVPDPTEPNRFWYLDGAHTVESLDCGLQWFVSPGVGISQSVPSTPVRRVLIFNCTSGRSGASFLQVVNDRIAEQLQVYKIDDQDPTMFFDRVIFCTNVTYTDGHFKKDLTTKAVPESDLAHLTAQRQLADAWTLILPSYPQEKILVMPSIEHAVTHVRTIDASVPVKVLVTGSLHLVGGVIEVAGLSEVAL